MKLNKLYLRILITYLILLVITEFAIFGFFVLFAGKKYRDYYNQYNEARINIAREITEYQLSKAPADSPHLSPSFVEFLSHLGLAFKTKIWISGENDQLLYKSFPGPIPSRTKEYELEEKHFHDSIFQRPKIFKIYRFYPIKLGTSRTGTLHMLFSDRPPFPHKEGFAIGLLGIGLIVALLTLPLAHKISKPIKTLTESAKKLEQGNLSHRTTVNSKDEIGELAAAFNRMAGKLEGMVKSGKELTAQVSHELRSPLARIQIAVEILKDSLLTEEDSETANHLKEIQVDVEELDRIIGRILELSKLDLQSDVPYTEVFSPVKLLKETQIRYESSLKNKKIKVFTDWGADAKIIGNRDAFCTVFNNLLDNSCKYTPTQGTMRLTSQMAEGGLVISVGNSGQTVSEPDLQKIFNPFVRLSANGETGAGLGLSIAKKIVEKHQGTITANNTESGLEFTIKLPVVRLD